MVIICDSAICSALPSSKQTILPLEIENNICSLLQDLLSQKINAIKEPRISILLDAWEGAILKTIPNLKIVVTIRHPAEVASSLQKRDNLSQIVGVQLWVQATLNTIKFARDYSNYFIPLPSVAFWWFERKSNRR